MNRREFTGGLIAAATLPLIKTSSALGQTSRDATPVALNAIKRTIEIKGKAATVFGLAQPDGAKGLVLDAGRDYRVALTNALDDPTMIHWHGLTPSWTMDGVPDLPKPLLRPGETRDHLLPAGAGGTHWMHAHTLQEQNLLAAPLIVRTAEDRARDEQEVAILLHDFSFTPAEELLSKLRVGGHGMAMGGMHHGGAMGRGGMGMMDVNDIAFDAYLANDRTLDDPEVTRVEKGGRVRLRIINGATATGFTIDTGGLDAALIAVDGQDVTPIQGRRFPIAMGQRLDLRIALPNSEGAWPILALREAARERAGWILATPAARVAKLPVSGATNGPVLDLGLEARLRAAAPLPAKNADRRFAVMLTGGMGGYDWGMASNAPLLVKTGQRIEIAMRNMSMMMHPMHLHGHHFQVVAINGRRFAGAKRDTVMLTHMAEVVVAFDADNSGKWAFHCHHLYHMAAGMMDVIAYQDVA